MSGVRLDNVSKVFGDVRAVDRLRLDIEPGEFVSILGPSGCGKTTLLRMLAGLERPSEGRISIGDRVVNDVSPADRNIAMVFQSYALYPHMSVGSNIEYPLKKRRVPKHERKQRVEQAAELLQLEALLDRKPRELSGGQQQRVALGRALVRDPEVFLMDEPLSNLDAKLRSHMRAELIELHRRIGRTMIYVTHDQLEAMTMSNRIAVMHEGRLQQFASPEEIYARPANDFVAGFIGMPPMNLIDGTLSRKESAAIFRKDGWKLELGQDASRDTGSEQSVRIGFRPEHLLLTDSGDEARVTVVEPTGHELIVVFDLHGNRIVGRLDPELRLKPDDVVRVAPRRDRIHVFAAADGMRVGNFTTGGPTEP
jgi:multiple sugar transport system ATP-binding protein